MKESISRIANNTGQVLSALHRATREAGPTFHNNDWMILAALTPPIIAAFALSEIGAWAIDEIGRQIRIREPLPASPSLRGTPKPGEIADLWAVEPRTLRTRLCIGSRLADLDPTLDHTISRTTLPNGKTVFRSRKGGVKGWLDDRRVPVPYSTVMRYKKLAQRLRLVLQLDERLPLEWLIDGIPGGQDLPAELQKPFRDARRRFCGILRENRTFKALSLYAEKQLGVVRLVSVRKAPERRRSGGMKRDKKRDFSVISKGRIVNVAPERVEATKAAMGRLLEAGNLSGRALHLQNRLRHWLSAVCGGSRNVPPAEPCPVPNQKAGRTAVRPALAKPFSGLIRRP
jgi:hypothetical protein